MNHASFTDIKLLSQEATLIVRKVSYGEETRPDCLMVLPGYLSRRQQNAEVLAKTAMGVGMKIDIAVMGFQGWDDSDVRIEDTSPESHIKDALNLYEHLLEQYRKIHFYGTSYGAFIGVSALVQGAEFSSVCLRTPAIYFESDLATQSHLVARGEEVQTLRRNTRELHAHPLMHKLGKRIEKDPIESLVIEHGDDVDTPHETSLAYASTLNAALYIAPGVQHSAKDAQTDDAAVRLSDVVHFAWLGAVVDSQTSNTD